MTNEPIRFGANSCNQYSDWAFRYIGIGFRHFIFGFPPPYDAESLERLISEVKPALAAS